MIAVRSQSLVCARRRISRNSNSSQHLGQPLLLQDRHGYTSKSNIIRWGDNPSGNVDCYSESGRWPASLACPHGVDSSLPTTSDPSAASASNYPRFLRPVRIGWCYFPCRKVTRAARAAAAIVPNASQVTTTDSLPLTYSPMMSRFLDIRIISKMSGTAATPFRTDV